MVTAQKVTASGIHGKQPVVQHVHENGIEDASTTFVRAIYFACEGFKTKRESAKQSERNKDKQFGLVETHAAVSTIHVQLKAA